MQVPEVRIANPERFSAIMAEDREAFRSEHRILLTAQVALAEAQIKSEARTHRLADIMDKTVGTVDGLVGTVDHLVGTVDKLADTADKLAAAQAHTDQKLAETTDKLDALIDLMDRHLREQGDKPQ